MSKNLTGKIFFRFFVIKTMAYRINNLFFVLFSAFLAKMCGVEEEE